MKARRSTIRLGPGGVLYVLAMSLILAAALYTQANLLFWGFGLCVGGIGVSLLLSAQALKGVSVERLLPTHVVAGEAFVMRYHLRHRSWLPLFSLVITENWGRGSRGWKRHGATSGVQAMLRGRPFGWVQHLGPQQTIQAESPCWPQRRGVLAFERVVLSTSFPFGVICKTVEFHQPAKVLVFPALHRMSRRVVGSLAQTNLSGRQHTDRKGGHEEFFGLREYRVGDSLKTVDWKHTAKTNTMVAREMTLPCPPRIMILLDLQHTPAFEAHACERAISLTASVICDAYLRGDQIGLVVRGARCSLFPIHHSLPHRTRMLEALAQLDLSLPQSAHAPSWPAEPSVVIHPGAGDLTHHAPSGALRKTVLGAAHMEHYLASTALGSSEILSRAGAPQSQHQRLSQAPESRHSEGPR